MGIEYNIGPTKEKAMTIKSWLCTDGILMA